MRPAEQPSGYRSSRITPTSDAVILAPERQHFGRRVLNAALDIAALPLVALGPRRRVSVSGHVVPLHYGFRRWTWRTERCVELGLAKCAIARHAPHEVLEIGNVLPMADIRGHTVLDKYEAGPDVINEDIIGFDPGRRYDLVVSISTLEHVGFDEIPQDPDKARMALDVISGLVSDEGDLLVTIPVGYHRRLQEALATHDAFDSVALLVKTSRVARWEQRPPSEMGSLSYGRPYACGNAILVGVRGRPLG